MIQIPHHGSRRNLSPWILDRLLGTIRAFDTPTVSAFVSAAVDGEPKHPSKRVLNALRRRGAKAFVTAGQSKYHFEGVPLRAGWSTVQPEPFFARVERV
jgi:hypothetical protein